MPNLNRVQLEGHLGADPEVRYTGEGKAIANIRIATTEKRPGAEDRTEWHRIVILGPAAEAVKTYLRKGDAVKIDGKIQTRSYDKDGPRTVTEIVAFDAWKSCAAMARAEEKAAARRAGATSKAFDFSDEPPPPGEFKAPVGPPTDKAGAAHRFSYDGGPIPPGPTTPRGFGGDDDIPF